MFENYPDVVTIDHLMEMLRIGRNSAYKLLKTNNIPHVKVGRKYIIPKKSVISFVTGVYDIDPQTINSELDLSDHHLGNER